jgi:hypothetical protein
MMDIRWVIYLLLGILLVSIIGSFHRESFEGSPTTVVDDGITFANGVYTITKGVSTKDMNVDGRIYFKDPSFSPTPNGFNNSDPYYMEKKVDGSNVSSLRITMNDDADESLQLWGNSCGSPGGCGGAGTMKHTFAASGDVIHTGNIILNDSPKNNSWIIHTPHDTRNILYFAPGTGPDGKMWDWNNQIFMKSDGTLGAKQLCAGSVCVNETQLRKLL